MWYEGKAELNNKSIQYWVKAFDEPSDYGINDGRISKLTIKVNGQTTVNYDRGWDIKPNEADEDLMLAYNELIERFN